MTYALSGSFTWLGGTAVLVFGDPRFVNLLNIDVVTVLAVPVLILFTLWIGWLVAFADRKAGPIRLFLDGLLLSTATVALVGLSAQKILPTPPERAAPSESTPVTLKPPASDGAEPGNESESAVPQSTDETEGANETPD